MSAWTALLLAALAPAYYFAIGAPWVASSPPARRWLAPLVGCFLSGWAAEASLVLGISPRWAVLAAALPALGLLLLRPFALGPLLRPLRDYYLLYLAAAPAFAWMLFPSMWHWTGDWIGNFRMGTAVFHGLFSDEFLARTAVQGATAVPLLAFGDGIVPFQVSVACCGAAALSALVSGATSFGKRLPARFLLAIAVAPFFLLHVAAMWAKLLAAGCLVAAAVEAARPERTVPGRFRLWFWAMAAVSVHHSSLIYLPLLAALLWNAGDRAVALHAVAAAFLFLLLVAPYEIWVTAQVGLARKVANDPSVFYRPAGSPLGNAFLVALSTATGWMPVEIFRAFRAAWGGGPHALLGAGYVAVAGWVSALASSLAGIFLFPAAALLWNRGDWRPLLPPPAARRPVFAALAFLLVAHTLLSPYPSAHGLAQNGLAPFCLLLFLWVGIVGGMTPRAVDLWLGLSAGLGLLPYVAVNGLLLGLRNSERGAFALPMLRERVQDVGIFLDRGFQSFASLTFPAVPLLVLAALALLARRNPALGPAIEEETR